MRQRRRADAGGRPARKRTTARLWAIGGGGVILRT